MLRGSSGHLILDIEEAQDKIRMGNEIAFYPGYGPLLAASTSPYVLIVVIESLIRSVMLYSFKM